MRKFSALALRRSRGLSVVRKNVQFVPVSSILTSPAEQTKAIPNIFGQSQKDKSASFDSRDPAEGYHSESSRECSIY